MTAVPYNLDSQWDVPAYIWPAVLGCSVALHLAVLVYGLPAFPWSSEKPVDPVKTEVILEEGGPVFEAATAVEIETVEAAVPQTAETDPSVIPAKPLVPQADAIEATAVSSQSVQVATVAAERPETVVAGQVQSQQAPQAALSPVQEISPVLPEAGLQTSPEPETAAAAVPLATVVPDVKTPASVAPATVTGDEDIGPAVVLQAQEAAPISSVAAPSAAVEPVAPLSGVSAVEAVAPVNTPTAVVVAPAAGQPVVQSNQDVAPVLAQENATVVASSGTEPETANAISPPPVSDAQVDPGVSATVTPSSGSGQVGTPDAVAIVTQTSTPAVQPVDAVKQELAAVQPSDIDTSTVSPNRPETTPVPVFAPPADAAPGVPPEEVASIDPLAKVTSYVAGYDPGACAHLTVTDAGAESASVAAYGAGIEAFIDFDRKFAADQGFEANVAVTLITRPQCALLEALGLSNGIEAAGLVDLDRTVVKSGSAVTGIVQRDLPLDRIAEAQQSGMPLNGRGPPELYVIDDAGQIHDGRGFILPASNAVTAGGWRFAVPVTLQSRAKSETALVLAVWNRPSRNQPARFGTLPANRIASVLAEPGVFSLSSFKVSR
ncbi:hypothetical protein [Roseibium aggregatum]|uniref:Uncharacterized protein n=1 Tax=Roseibium aggregatum TaxID=187304 RepID=A0A939ED53_9HYPH|nr:hypothetical protein [Roseibium aggregatum]MBN9670387.1 hypothetical protein [Roseibium aggregatum]